LLEEEVFKHDEELIIDECLALIIGGALTVSAADTNTLIYLNVHNKDARTKLEKEIYDKLYIP
jgi:hypothetical protein